MFESPSVLFGSIATGAIAIIISFLLNETRIANAARLYCIPSSSHHFITTLNGAAPRAKCFRVTQGLFTDVLDAVPTGEKDITWLDGHVIPGIIESHGHMLQYGEMMESVSLYGSKSVGEVRERVKAFVKAHHGDGLGTKKKWIRGIGWDQKYFGGVMPTAEELSDDPELKDLYIMLDRVDVHCVLVSQKVLSLLPHPLPPAPPGGMVITDPGAGVFCDNAVDAIITPKAPKRTYVSKVKWIRNAMTELNKLGIVGVGDAGIREEDVRVYKKFVHDGELTLRVRFMFECKNRNTFCPEEVRWLKDMEGEGIGGSTLLLGGVKLFADGALGSRGAALLEPYSDSSKTSGVMLINETDLTRVVGQWYGDGYQVNVHAIGDRANRAAVDAFESVLGSNCHGCNDARRLRIEHAQIIHPNDQKRIEKMGIIPSIQPTHATSDMAYAHSRLGSDRLDHSAYRMASLFPSASSPKSKYPGPVLGSDFPVEPANPFHGMYAAVTRLNPATGSSPSGEGGWYPGEALSVEQALLGFTRNAAYGWGKEGIAGAIEVGKWADWVVVDRDVLADKTGRSLRDVEVRETWVGGKKVFSRMPKKARGWLGKIFGGSEVVEEL